MWLYRRSCFDYNRTAGAVNYAPPPKGQGMLPDNEKPGYSAPLLRDVFAAAFAGGWVAVMAADVLPPLGRFLGALASDFSWGDLLAVLKLPFAVMAAGFFAALKMLLSVPLWALALAAGYYAARGLLRRGMTGLAPLVLAGFAAGLAGGAVPVLWFAHGEGWGALARGLAVFCGGGALAGVVFHRRLRQRPYMN